MGEESVRKIKPGREREGHHRRWTGSKILLGVRTEVGKQEYLMSRDPQSYFDACLVLLSGVSKYVRFAT